MKLSKTLSAVASVAVMASATGAMAHWNNDGMHNDGKKYGRYDCARLIDNSASPNVAHKGGTNTPTAKHDLTFNNCTITTAANERYLQSPALMDGVYVDDNGRPVREHEMRRDMPSRYDAPNYEPAPATPYRGY